jgi:hypothetical protein
MHCGSPTIVHSASFLGLLSTDILGIIGHQKVLAYQRNGMSPQPLQVVNGARGCVVSF